MVRLLPLATVIPALAESVLPSCRIRYTLPVTTMRLEIVTLLELVYQPELHAVDELVRSVALAATCAAPVWST